MPSSSYYNDTTSDSVVEPGRGKGNTIRFPAGLSTAQLPKRFLVSLNLDK